MEAISLHLGCLIRRVWVSQKSQHAVSDPNMVKMFLEKKYDVGNTILIKQIGQNKAFERYSVVYRTTILVKEIKTIILMVENRISKFPNITKKEK